MLTIFGKPNCTYCDQAKMLATREGVEFEYIDLTSEDGSLYLAGIKQDGFSTVPAIYKDGDKVGGFNEFKKMVLGA